MMAIYTRYTCYTRYTPLPWDLDSLLYGRQVLKKDPSDVYRERLLKALLLEVAPVAQENLARKDPTQQEPTQHDLTQPAQLEHLKQIRPFEFTGETSEYFRIWIVNIFLTILTLGIYSAWAKVRRKRYFYANTLVDGSSFAYLGEPARILKGRLVVVAGAAIIAAIMYSVALAQVALFFIFLLVWPLLVVTALRFNARYSAYRNIRFSFHGTMGQAMKTYLLGYLAVIFTLGLGYYWFTWRRHQYRITNSRFGTSSFTFDLAQPDGYFVTYLAAGLFGSIITAGFGLFTVPLLSAVAPESFAAALIEGLPAIVLGLFYFTYLKVRFTNIQFNNARIAGHSFESSLEVIPLFWIYFTNLLAIVFSVGLLTPWAMIRSARYRADRLTLLIRRGDLNDLVGAEQENASAIGEEIGELLDLDLGL